MKNAAALLIFVPLALLAGVAAFGLIEYRHSVTAEARSVAEEWADRAPRYRQAFAQKLAQARPVQLYPEFPATTSTGPDRTETGLPQTVLDAWEDWKKSGTREDAERVAQLAIHESPSAISAPLVRSLAEKFPDADWQDQWQDREERRAILRAHPDHSGFVARPNGAAMIDAKRVLTPGEVRNLARQLIQEESPPKWMGVNLVAAGHSLLEPVENRLAAKGESLRVEVGLLKPDLLYARYHRTVWWVTALISCALLTAVAGVWLIQRTLRRERRLGELKSQFVASVSHELRTPISSMRLMADALDSKQVDEETRSDFHRLMSKEGARLSTLIENVLDFARIEEGRKTYSFLECDLVGIVRDTLSLMELVAAERGVTIDAVIEEDAHEQSVDPPSIQQALINLLDNALKFSPQGGAVEVTLVSRATVWKLVVEDRGPGIPLADRERIFERFTRLGNELRREEQGTGIGLAIVKHIAEAHGAKISVEDRTDGGARFVLQATAPPGQTMRSSSKMGADQFSLKKKNPENAAVGH
jgi:two-component system phosphate regulon sensor histidine kinase PhoR